MSIMSVPEQFEEAIAELIVEYISEAEHQEGDSYWEEHTLAELVVDFGLYLQNREECPPPGRHPFVAAPNSDRCSSCGNKKISPIHQLD